MENTIWNFTIAAISPMFSYSSFTGDSSTGWATWCTTNDVYNCDDNTAHVTGIAASVSLNFVGSGIAFYGNVTNSMSVTLTLEDGTTSSVAPNPSSQLLTAFEGLPEGNHTVTLSTSPSSPAALLYFTEAIVSLNTNISNSQPDITYIDDLSPSITYGSYWFPYPNYSNDTQLPVSEGGDNQTFHASNAVNTTASLRFNAAAVLLYGPCYAATGLFTVSLDPGPGTLVLNTTAEGPQVGAHVFSNCLRYFATGLDPTVERQITMTNIENGTYATLDYIELISFFSSGSGSGGSGSGDSNGGSSSSSGKSNVGAIVGGVIGGLAVIILLLLLLFFLRRRRQRARARPEPFRPRVSLVPGEGDPPSPALATASTAILPGTSAGATSNSDGRTPATEISHNPLLSPSVGSTGTMLGGSMPPMSQKAQLLHQLQVQQGRLQRAQAAPASTLSNIESVSPPTTAATASTPSAPSSAAAGRAPAVVPAPTTQSSASPLSAISPAAATTTSLPPNPDSVEPPSLSQISNDVNRIIAQLSRLGRPPAPGGTGEEDWEDEGEWFGDEEEAAPGQAPPAYGESHVR